MEPDFILQYSQRHVASPFSGINRIHPLFLGQFVFATAPYLWFIHTYVQWIPLLISLGFKWLTREADRFSTFMTMLMRGVECSLRPALVACCLFKHRTTVLLVPCSKLHSLFLLRFSNPRFCVGLLQ
jgi:hypothetical protein